MDINVLRMNTHTSQNSKEHKQCIEDNKYYRIKTQKKMKIKNGIQFDNQSLPHARQCTCIAFESITF